METAVLKWPGEGVPGWEPCNGNGHLLLFFFLLCLFSLFFLSFFFLSLGVEPS